MKRREALKRVAYLMGGAISATTIGVLFESFTPYDSQKTLYLYSDLEEKVLSEFADIILPSTASSPGAKAAGVGLLIPLIVKDCYPPDLQTIFKEGYKDMLSKSKIKFNKDFLDLNNNEKISLIKILKQETINNNKEPSFFLIARDLTILCYFSSEIGCKQAREYLPVPGKYDGNVPYTEDQKAWAIS